MADGQFVLGDIALAEKRALHDDNFQFTANTVLNVIFAMFITFQSGSFLKISLNVFLLLLLPSTDDELVALAALGWPFVDTTGEARRVLFVGSVLRVYWVATV